MGRVIFDKCGILACLACQPAPVSQHGETGRMAARHRAMNTQAVGGRRMSLGIFPGGCCQVRANLARFAGGASSVF